jgi:hypothetical protein
MAAPNRSYKLRQFQLFIEFPFTWFSNLQFADTFFYLKIFILLPVRHTLTQLIWVATAGCNLTMPLPLTKVYSEVINQKY